MADFAGLIRLDGAPVSPESIAILRRSVASRFAPAVWQPDASVVFVEGLDADSFPPRQEQAGQVLLVDVWLENPQAIQQALGTSAPAANRTLTTMACAAWGVEAAIQRLHGDVAVALWEAPTRRLTLARDAMGALPIYFVVTPGLLLFATSLQTMLALPETPRELDLVTLAHTLTIGIQDQEQTLYRQIRRVPPGGLTVFERGRCRSWRYYTADTIKPVRLAGDDAYVEAGRSLLDQAVACRLPERGPYATQLSGGFDSGGVAATAARLLAPGSLTAYTRAPSSADYPDEGIDELQLAGKLVERYSNIEWVVVDKASEPSRDFRAEAEAGAVLVPRTSGFNTAWFESLMLEVEQRGASVLLQGKAGNSTLSYGGRPPLFADLQAGRRAKLVEEQWRASDHRGPFSRTLAAALFKALAPRALKRWRVHRRQGPMPWLAYSLVSPEFLASLDYEVHARAVGNDIPFDPPYDSRELRLRELQGQRGRDFRGFIRRKQRNFATRDPYQDRRLVDFCLGIPDDQYWRDGNNRWLARRVLADRVPAETLAKRVRGRQSPEWFVTATSRRERMAEEIDRIAASPLASRVLDVPRMRTLLDCWPRDAEAAHRSRSLHGHGLQRAIDMGGFLRWYETHE